MNLLDFIDDDKYTKVKEVLQPYLHCTKCPELQGRTQVVLPTIEALKHFSGVMFIGEAPGLNEDKLGKPFVGKSGYELDKLLDEIGLKREEVYITNTLLCRPPNNRDPKPTELKNCSNRLKSEIEIIKPKAIVTLGNFATKYVFKNSNKPELQYKGITSLRGNVYDVKVFDIETHVLPMFHPAVILYSGGNKRSILQQDFKKLKDLLQNTD